MQVLGRDKLAAFKKSHPQARVPLDAWLAEAQDATWQKWADIKARYPSADSVGKHQVVFNIKGNSFRLVVLVYYAHGRVIIEKVGTHADYDKWKLGGS